jgi:hypothetical protein
MTTPPAQKYGWFRYGRHPEGKVGQWTITRSPDDPPLVVWKVADDVWIVDDDPGEQHIHVDGFTEADIQVALAFAQAMGWVTAGTEYAIRELPPAG